MKPLKYKTSELPSKPTDNFILPALTAGIQNQGLNNFIPINDATILENVISISANGANTGATFYQSKQFTVLQDAYAIEYKNKTENLNDNKYIFLTASISKNLHGHYEWTNKAGWEKVKKENIFLPTTQNNTPDYDFMEALIADLERANKQKVKSYLAQNGLDNTVLTDKEKLALEAYKNVKWGTFNLKKLFGASTRGRRLKSLDRISGSLPFVTAGEADEGVSAFIGNNVIVFPENTITIDMFGSAKYRNYKYGADDHVAVVHTQNLSKYASIFITQAIHKVSYTGEFHYGRNFYAKDADELNISLPIKPDKTPDYDFMDTLITALHKLMVKKIVNYIEEV